MDGGRQVALRVGQQRESQTAGAMPAAATIPARFSIAILPVPPRYEIPGSESALLEGSNAPDVLQ
jgi:hypothetical protein